MVDAVVLHDTASEGVDSVFAWFSNPESQASAHYLIDRDGTTYRLVAEERKAWHAGASMLHGRDDVNQFSIGIELVDKTDDPYPDAQLQALTELTVEICTRHRIPLNRIVAHSDIAVPRGRKQDPGGDFDWFSFLAVVGAGMMS